MPHSLNQIRSKQWLAGWGAVLRERIATGDPSAIPNGYAPTGQDGLAGARRSGPSNLPGIHEVYLSIEAAILPGETLLRTALEAKYVYGCHHRVAKFLYELPDSTIVAMDADPISGQPTETEPVGYRSRTAIEEEIFELRDGLDAAQIHLPAASLSLLQVLSIQMGTTPCRLLQEAAHRFERYTLPKRAGW